MRTSLYKRLLFCCWCFGLFFGAFLFVSIASPKSTFIVSTTDSSFLGAITVRIISFTFCLFACLHFPRYLLLACFFAKSLIISFCSSYLIFSYGTAGWLVYLLLFLTDLFFCAAMMFITIDNYIHARFINRFLLSIVFLLGCCYLDVYIVSPILDHIL